MQKGYKAKVIEFDADSHDFKIGEIVTLVNPIPDDDGDFLFSDEHGLEQWLSPKQFIFLANQLNCTIEHTSLVKIAVYLEGIKHGKGDIYPLGNYDLQQLWAAIDKLKTTT